MAALKDNHAVVEVDFSSGVGEFNDFSYSVTESGFSAYLDDNGTALEEFGEVFNFDSVFIKHFLQKPIGVRLKADFFVGL
jgi:hypothetical protein